MAQQPLWDIYESAILLDAYLKECTGEFTHREAIEFVSRTLRKMAINNGRSIDSIYRNENGISFQIMAMESAYTGHTVVKEPSRLFLQTVKLYRSDPDRYDRILCEAYKRASK